jgi:hypothetical protein
MVWAIVPAIASCRNYPTLTSSSSTAASGVGSESENIKTWLSAGGQSSCRLDTLGAAWAEGRTYAFFGVYIHSSISCSHVEETICQLIFPSRWLISGYSSYTHPAALDFGVIWMHPFLREDQAHKDHGNPRLIPRMITSFPRWEAFLGCWTWHLHCPEECRSWQPGFIGCCHALFWPLSFLGPPTR